MPLTARQQAILDHLRAQVAAEGRPPTLGEIASAFDIHLNAARKHLHALAAKGALQLAPGKARGIRLLDVPATGRQLAAASTRRAHFELPLVGRVAAGSPIMSEGNIEARFAIDPALFRPRADYLLRVQGESMREAGIRDGDLIAVHRTPEALDGQIVVARIEDEITVKRLRTEADRIVLLPENPDFRPIVVDARAGSFAIEGVYVGAIRRT
ncbi:MAG TPA: transcriptional repressor LexA [Xanthomonadaceae bacterium]